MVRRFLRRVQVARLLRAERGFLQQRHHAQQPVERRADLVAHVGEEHALRAAGRLRLEARRAEPRGQRLEPLAAQHERAELAQHDEGEDEQQHALEQRERDALLTLRAHRVVALGDPLVQQVRGAERQVVQRRAQRIHLAEQLAHRAGGERLGRRAREVAVGVRDEGPHTRHRGRVHRLRPHDARGALMVHEPQAAHEDVVAQLKPLACRAGGVGHRLLHLVAQPKVLGLELEEAPAERVVLELRGAVEQPVLLPLHVGRTDQGQRERRADQREPVAARAIARRRGGRGQVLHRTSSCLSCHAARL